MNKRNAVIFLLIIAVVGMLTYSSFYGLNLGKFELVPVKDDIKLGLDLEGGVFVVLEAQTDLTGEDLKEKMIEAKSIISERVDGLGVTQPVIVIEGDKRIRIELPGIKNTQDALDMIGKTAKLEFTDPQGNVVLTGENVRKSKMGFDQYKKPAVDLQFDKDGAKKFAELTKILSTKSTDEERVIPIILDGKPISVPVLQRGLIISDGKAQITGKFTVDEASNLATLIRAGALPLEMKEMESSVIGPTLGLESLDKSVYAAGIGLIGIFLFMIIMYRIPGFIADIALTIFILLVLGSMILMKASLTLPGIAGLILSIGMAVDANVVIFERIKEELRAGKTIRSAVDAGFKRAIKTVMDANITTLIAGIVLFYFGTGPIKGFAVTLVIGIIASLITAVFVTKYLLKLIISLNITKNNKLYGA
ncbi:protein translocase subunit SecD [Abyssisolibacter fermentans]|uniref:protein translocase subunit SecD n=1 Tax=Abyssisolibacter fermentans TaxID=1766203 RepID=UPI00082A5D1B|nr:protein translocase subunit SecD [Abyssisolibacter fermentans]